jgi:hypothetical protein
VQRLEVTSLSLVKYNWGGDVFTSFFLAGLVIGFFGPSIFCDYSDMGWRVGLYACNLFLA